LLPEAILAEICEHITDIGGKKDKESGILTKCGILMGIWPTYMGNNHGCMYVSINMFLYIYICVM
jgi:hypothetical protein